MTEPRSAETRSALRVAAGLAVDFPEARRDAPAGDDALLDALESVRSRFPPAGAP